MSRNYSKLFETSSTLKLAYVICERSLKIVSFMSPEIINPIKLELGNIDKSIQFCLFMMLRCDSSKLVGIVMENQRTYFTIEKDINN